MIPEIYENFRLLEYWWKKRKEVHENAIESIVELRSCIEGNASRYEYDFIRLKYDYFMQQVNFVQWQIDSLKHANNEIAKEHGNSYYDEKGKMVWIPSKLAQK